MNGYYGTYTRLGVPVSASPRAVIRAARRKLQPAFLASRANREARRVFYGLMIENHRDARECARAFAL